MTLSIWKAKLNAVKAKKNVLIITDGAERTSKMAGGIAIALNGYKVVIKAASDFKGNDILPAETFFLGCEKPKPESFAYVEDLLKHINLAGRSCGVFSPGSGKTLKYLTGLVKDCEASLYPDHLSADSEAKMNTWAQSVISHSF